MEAKLFEAACSGNLQPLYDVVGQSGVAALLKLHLLGSIETPLHLASMFGQAEFVREYMKLSSLSANQLSQLNQDGCSPLHLASAAGHLEIVTFLLEFGKQKSAVEELCMKKDRDRRTALHSAVVNGRIAVVDVLLVNCPQAAKEVTAQQETILHLAVKHHQQESLEFLIGQKLGSSVEDLLNVGDREGNTILHLATANRQLQTVEYLVKQLNLNVNAENSYGLRALDIMHACALNSKDMYIEEAIRLAGGCRSQLAATTNQTRPSHDTQNTSRGSISLADDWLKELRSGIIVMASVFATLTFQVALTPPGGVWQDWGSNATTMSNSSVVPARQPGVPILYNLDPKQFNKVTRLNTLTFMISVATIILMIQPFKIQSVAPGKLRYVVLAPYVVLFNVIFMAVDFLSIGTIMTKKSLTSSHFWRTSFHWVLILVFAFFFGTALYFLPLRRGSRPSQNTQSSSNSSSQNSSP